MLARRTLKVEHQILRVEEIVAAADRLSRRIEERFPNAGPSQQIWQKIMVAGKL